MNKLIIIILLFLTCFYFLKNKSEHFSLKEDVNQYINIGIPLFRVSSYIERPLNLTTVNNHINDNNLNTQEKQIRYLEQLERQLKLNEDQLAEEPDMVIDDIGIPIADYETNLKKRYEREVQRLSEVDVQLVQPVLDKTWFQSQIERDLEPPEPVEIIDTEDVTAVQEIKDKNQEQSLNKTDVSQMLNLLKLKEQTQTHFNKDLNKTSLFIKKPVLTNLQKQQLDNLNNEIPNLINQLKQQELENRLQQENELQDTDIDISQSEKESTINTVKQFIEEDINQVQNNIDSSFIIDEGKSLSEIEEQKKSKLFATELASKIINQDIQQNLFKIRDVVQQYFEVSNDNELNEEIEDLF